ncbi:PspC domain-containing protein [Leifsonia sp. A12D58]|uniref:ATP-binding protein n=1 Tax=Leifsonia sp. A12D58 TaxID=3397674 RepID=UPI0039DFF72D
MKTERMTRPRLRIIGGVCAGFAEHTGLPVNVVRVATVILAFCGGAGILLYAWLWATTPAAGSTAARSAALPKASLVTPAGAPFASSTTPAPEAFSPADSARTAAQATAQTAASTQPLTASDATATAASSAASARTAPVTEILLGLALLAAGVALIASRYGASIPLAVIIPAIVVLAGVALAWRQFADLRSGAALRTSAILVRILGALVLVAVGILLFFVTGEQPNVWTVVVAAAAVLIGVAVVLAPWLIRLFGDLADERAARVREAERAEIAAHLHDSVLQTLALIQQKAGPHSDAARLARAQERELREWLFTGAESTRVDLATELRRVAGIIEEDHAVRFEIVTAGSGPEDAPEGLVAAAREAMLNAARHAGGTVTVYLESGARGIELSVTDRGPGFSLDDIPEDRLGVRESILGRMRRVGGSAAVRPGPGGSGTEILLTMPASHSPEAQSPEPQSSEPQSSEPQSPGTDAE